MGKVGVVPDQVDAMDALEVLRRAEVPMVMVHDEYGHFEGIATPADLLSAIAGHFVSDLDSADEPELVEREDGSLLASGGWDERRVGKERVREGRYGGWVLC